MKASIERAVPEVEVVWVRDLTGLTTARFLAEKENPRADLVIGLAASSLLMFEKLGLLETYKPARESIPEGGVPGREGALYLDRYGRLTWASICFNTVEAGPIDGIEHADAPGRTCSAPA